MDGLQGDVSLEGTRFAALTYRRYAKVTFDFNQGSPERIIKALKKLDLEDRGIFEPTLAATGFQVLRNELMTEEAGWRKYTRPLVLVTIADARTLNRQDLVNELSHPSFRGAKRILIEAGEPLPDLSNPAEAALEKERLKNVKELFGKDGYYTLGCERDDLAESVDFVLKEIPRYPCPTSSTTSTTTTATSTTTTTSTTVSGTSTTTTTMTTTTRTGCHTYRPVYKQQPGCCKEDQEGVELLGTRYEVGDASDCTGLCTDTSECNMLSVHLTTDMKYVCSLLGRRCNVGFPGNSTACSALGVPEVRGADNGACRCFYGVGAFHNGDEFAVDSC